MGEAEDYHLEKLNDVLTWHSLCTTAGDRALSE